jgi:hypothetical protein
MRLAMAHGGASELFVLAQEEEVLADLVVSQGGRVALNVIGQPADHPHLLLFGRRAVIFEFDKLSVLLDRGIGKHRGGRALPSGTISPPITAAAHASQTA